MMTMMMISFRVQQRRKMFEFKIKKSGRNDLESETSWKALQVAASSDEGVVTFRQVSRNLNRSPSRALLRQFGK
jgi:glycine cleavage system aminomethyltransferase T